MQDLRDAIRQLRHRPALSLAITLTLALGIGANALVFSVVHAVLLEPLPFHRPERLVTVWQTQPGNSTRRVAPANFLDWRAAASFDGLAAYDSRRRSLVRDEPERITVATVSANFFEVLGVDAIAGRALTAPVGAGTVREVVLREDLWQRAFGRDPSVLGRTIQLDDETLIVVGVVATSKAFPEDVQAWAQAPHDVPELSVGVPTDIRTVRDARYFRVLGRLRDGITQEQAQAELDAIAAKLRAAYPDANADTGVNIVPLKEHVTGGSARTLWILFGVVACVLAIACGNVAALFLAAVLGRVRELQIRAAVGASTRRLLRQLTTESLLLAGLGSVAGLLLAWAFRPALIAVLPAATPRLASIEIDGVVLAFSLGTALLTCIVCGVVPGLVAVRSAGIAFLHDAGRSGPSRRTSAFASTLLAAQLALAVVLLAGTGLMLRTLGVLYDRDAGIDIERLLALDVTIPDARSRGRSAAVQDVARMVERINSLPGVTGAAAIQSLPLSSRGPSANLRVEGRLFKANEAPDVAWRTITPGYFRAAGVRILRGREFSDADRDGAPPVAIINAKLAKLLWPGADPVGKRIGTGLDGDKVLSTIVGIAADVPQEGIGASTLPEMYRPLAQPSRFSVDAMSIVVRTDGKPVLLTTASREAIRTVHPRAPISAIRPMTDVAAASIARELSAATSLAFFAMLALLLAAVGLHGVMARLVHDRGRELGVRIALGAAPRDVQWLVVRHTFWVAGTGILAGLLASVVLSRPLRAFLHGASALDPLVLTGASVVLLAVALVAAYGPARSAGRVDPLEVIRNS